MRLLPLPRMSILYILVRMGSFHLVYFLLKKGLYPLDNKYTTWACNQDLEYYESCLALGFACVSKAYSDLWQGSYIGL